MVRVSIEDNFLILNVIGSHKVYALKSQFKIPISHVRGATHDPGAWDMPTGIRAPGTELPGIFRAGTFYKGGERIFWDVRQKEKTVVLELQDEEFARLIIEVENPDEVVQLIEGAM